MASLVSALDKHTPIQYGENAHKEYGWSHELQESILQLSFQLTRTSDPATHKTLGTKYYDLINNVFYSTQFTKEKKIEFVSILYRIMLQTRDIVAGKGEYTLFYVLLGEWVRFVDSKAYTNSENIKKIAQTLIEQALISLISLDNFDHPYGSWKDFKYFLNYLRDRVASTAQQQYKTYTEWPTFQFIIKFMTDRLRYEETTFNSTNNNSLTLIARWIPREKSKKFGWQTPYFAYEYFSDWIKTATTEMKMQAAQRKCLTHYRKLIAKINGAIKTVQINQCDGNWGGIDFNKTSHQYYYFTSKEGISVYYKDRGIARK